ncbi:hypothetical protein Tco_0258998 [Tanacetum coccineum]
MFSSRRKRGAMIFEGQFVARLAEHFGLFTKQRLQGLTAWVATRLERQPDDAAGTLEVTEGAHDVDEGAQAVPILIQPPHAARPARSMA